jgi:hypothetical protein
VIYVYETCSGILPCDPKLKRFLIDTINRRDVQGNIMRDTTSPNYRVIAHSHGSVYTGGTERSPRLSCENKKLSFFFFKERVMQTRTWKEICENQLYDRKMILTEEKLDSVGWKITY